jgi:ABC-type transport system involved in multi-copper enzyme maturation permease subunit
MWLITSLVAAIVATIFYLIYRKRYRFDLLCLMFWGATIMILVDHVLGYEGGAFFEMETDGMISNGILLGMVMTIPVFIIWGSILLFERIRVNKVSTR